MFRCVGVLIFYLTSQIVSTAFAGLASTLIQSYSKFEQMDFNSVIFFVCVVYFWL